MGVTGCFGIYNLMVRIYLTSLSEFDFGKSIMNQHNIFALLKQLAVQT